MKTETFIIGSGTYPYSIEVIISKDLKKVAEFVNKKQRRKGKKKYRKHCFEKCYGVFCQHEDRRPIIWIPKRPKTAREICSVAHEILHAVFENMRWIGIDYNEGSEEAFTYLHTYLMQQFLNKCGIK